MKKLTTIILLALAVCASAAELNLADLGLEDQSLGATFSGFVYDDPQYDDPDAPSYCTINAFAIMTQRELIETAGVEGHSNADLHIMLTITIAEIEAAGGKAFDSMTRAESRTAVKGVAVAKIAAALGITLP
jgi:hypothetical protein